MPTRSVPDLGIEYDLWGEYPVQALGEVRGREFYFRAKHYEWEFEVADASGVLPSDGGKPEFVRRGKHRDARHMPHDEAATLIESFLREYAAAAAVDYPNAAMDRHRVERSGKLRFGRRGAGH